MFNIEESTIVKIELDYGEHMSGTSFHIGNSPTNDLEGIFIAKKFRLTYV